MACVYLTWNFQRSPVIQALSGSLVTHSSSSFDRCLLHWRPPCSALGRFLGRLYLTYSLALPWCFSGPVMFFLFSAGGYRQISAVTQFQAHLSGFLHWTRGPYSRAAGGSLPTGAVLKARSAGGVSGSFGRSVLKPKLLAGLLSRWFLTHWRCPQSALGRWCLRLLRPIGAQTQASCRVAVLRPKPYYSPSQIPSDF